MTRDEALQNVLRAERQRRGFDVGLGGLVHLMACSRHVRIEIDGAHVAVFDSAGRQVLPASIDGEFADALEEYEVETLAYLTRVRNPLRNIARSVSAGEWVGCSDEEHERITAELSKISDLECKQALEKMENDFAPF
jgi:hypothetical protein